MQPAHSLKQQMFVTNFIHNKIVQIKEK